MSGSNPLAVALGQVGQTNPLQFAQGYANLATSAQALKTSQFDLQQKQQGIAYDAMRRLAMTNPNPTNDDIQAALGEATRLGGNSDGVVSNLTAFTARGGKPSDFVRAYATGGMSPENQVQFGIGVPTRVETPQGILLGTQGGALSGAPGQFTLGTGIQKGLSPEQWATPTQVWDPKTQTYTSQPFGQAYGYPQPPGLGGGAATGGGASAAPGGGAVGAPGAGGGLTGDLETDRKIIAQRESRGNPSILNYVARNDPTAYARGATASGKYQFTNTTWQQGAQWAGVDTNQYPTAMSAPEAVQDKVFDAVYARLGTAPWNPATYGQNWVRGPGGQYVLQPTGGGAVAAAPGGARGGPFIGAASAQPVVGGGAVAPPGPGGVRPAGGPQYLDPMGRSVAPGGGDGYGGAVAPGGAQGPALPPHTLALPSPGFEKTAAASTEQFNAARANYTQQAQRLSPLEQSLATLRAHPDLQTGMTAMDFQNLNSLAQVLGVQLSPETLADGSALSEINKNLNRYYRSLPGAGRSDMAELDAKLSNPNPELQRDALDDLLARTIGTERMNDAGYMHFQEMHGSGNASNYAHQYADQIGQYTSSLDPVGFAFDKMTVQQRRAYYDSLSPTERTRYMNSIKEASRLYNLPIPQGGG